MVFDTTDITNGWDGKFKDKLCPSGKYAWMIFYVDNKKSQITNKGMVRLIR
ncbi:MAG: gliding motility-associated C-terminal domain-containing protein [Bacteroidales bacterium]|nr:gliding motility-associated C-terminal domain-containing protein [Bacteroidales bacterium]